MAKPRDRGQERCGQEMLLGWAGTRNKISAKPQTPAIRREASHQSGFWAAGLGCVYGFFFSAQHIGTPKRRRLPPIPPKSTFNLPLVGVSPPLGYRAARRSPNLLRRLSIKKGRRLPQRPCGGAKHRGVGLGWRAPGGRGHWWLAGLSVHVQLESKKPRVTTPPGDQRH